MKIRVGNNWYDTKTTHIDCDPVFGHEHDGPNAGAVKSVSINNGDPYLPDTAGNIDLPVGAITGNGLANDLSATTSVGGIQAGDTFEAGTSTEEVLRKLLIKEVAPAFSMTLNPTAGLCHKGDTVTLKSISYSVSQGTASALSSLSITDGVSKLVDIIDVKTGTKELSKAYTKDTEFTGTLMYLDKSGTPRSITTKSKYTFVDYTYAGVMTGIPTADEVAKLSTSLVGSLQKEVSYTSSAGQRMVYAYPASYGNVLSIIDVNGYKLGSFLENNISVKINGVDYKVYYSNEVEVTDYKVTFK